MAWNQPSNNGQDRDPWGNSNSSNNNSKANNNKGSCDPGPPDLYDIFRKLSKKLVKLSRNKKRSESTQSPHSHIWGYVMNIIIVATIIFWVASGFYIIKETERGVVTRFGKFNHLVEPGLNWKPTFIDDVVAVNVKSIRELVASGIMLTSDENIVYVEMNVQYQVTNPELYLFSVNNADDSLRQATDSALRNVVGKCTMECVLTEDRTIIRHSAQCELEDTIRSYKMGITLLDVNFPTIHPPEEVKAAFNDAIAARENEQQYIHEAEAYINEIRPRANGQAQRILEEARAYRTKTILEAQGEVSRFAEILPEYRAAPKITRERMYIETMEKIFSHTRKILIDQSGNNRLIVLSVNDIFKDSNILKNSNNISKSIPINVSPKFQNKSSSDLSVSMNVKNNNDIMDQRRANAQRNDNQRKKG